MPKLRGMRMRVKTGLAVLMLAAATACGQGAAPHAGLHNAQPAKPSAAPSPASTGAPAATPSGRPAREAEPERAEPAHDAQPASLPTCPHDTASPHFDTPQAMMRYLAAAWNRGDLDALCHVTNPDARAELAAMHSEAVNLRLRRCAEQAEGYVCYLDHDFPKSRHKHGIGHAVFDAGPADTPGWYMTVFESCD